MSKSLYFTKKIQVLDDKINSCISEIASIFDGIENLDKELNISTTDEIFTEELSDMLQKLVVVLSKLPGVAEFILPHLEEFRKQNAFSLLENSSIGLSNVEKNFIPPVENLTDKIISLWEETCHHLEKYSTKFVFESYMPLATLHNHFNLYQLKQFIFSLQHMFIPNLVWEKYRNYRCLYLEKYNCPCPTEGSCFSCCLKLTIQCIYEDEFLTYIGCFHPFIVTQSKVLETYTEIIDKKFYNLLILLEKCFNSKKDLPEELISILSSPNLSHIKTCFTCFIQSKIFSEVNSAVYCIQNNYGTESVWNVVFISLVISIIETILVFQDKISSLFHRKETMYHTHEDEFSLLLEGSKLILATESPEQSPFSKPLHQNSSKKQLALMEGEKIFLLWTWRLSMVENGYLSILQRSLQNDVENIVKGLIEKEKISLKCGQWKDLLMYDKEISFASELVQTNTLLQSVLSTVQTLEKYLPVLETTCDSFLSFKSSFCHTLETDVINLIRHLKEIAGCKNNCEIYYEYIAINNAFFLSGRLQNYHDILKGSVCETSQNNICQSITQLTKDLIESVYLHHFRYISCGILFDADSNNFEDQKPFFEGERISYSIQMWNLYLKGVLKDVSYFLPGKVSKELYAKILSSSLEHFLVRYSSATLSEARTSQVMWDLNTLLLCTSELLWPACSSVSQFIGRKHETENCPVASHINKIHSSCCYLLAILVVLTAPVSELHKAFKDGFPHPRLSIRTKYESVAPWLPWIRRELFSEFCQRQIVSNVSVWLAVKACTSCILPNPTKVVKAFTEYNCTLSILLMMQASSSSYSSNKNNICPKIFSKQCKIKLAYSFFEVLICYGNYSHLQDILLPVIEKTNGWQEFDMTSVNRKLSDRSWWYIGLVKTLKPYFVSVFEEIIPFWLEVSKKFEDSAALNAFIALKSNIINHVVCVCEKDPLNSLNDEFETSVEVSSFMCLKNVLESMQRNLVSLPQALKCFILSLNLHISNYVPEIQSAHQSLPLQILLSSAVDFLRNPEFIDKISNDLNKMVDITGNALESLLLKSEFSFLSENHTRIIKMLMSSIHGNFCDLKKDVERISETMHMKEIKDEVLEITVHKLLQLSHGTDTILYLHQLLCQNESWIQRSLGVPGMLSSDIVVNPLSPSPLLNDSYDLPEKDHREKDFTSFREQKISSQDRVPPDRSQEGSFDSGSKPTVENSFTHFSPSNFKDDMEILNLEVDGSISETKFDFNPLNCFDNLGESTFTKFVMEQPSFHWESILSHLPILGLTEVNLCTLLSHRWDVRNEGPLTVEELKCVEELKAMYKLTL